MKGQGEFKGMPERGKLGEKAIEYLNAKDELDNAKEELEKIKDELAQIFLTEGKTSIKVENRTISCVQREGFKITVKSGKLD